MAVCRGPNIDPHMTNTAWLPAARHTSVRNCRRGFFLCRQKDRRAHRAPKTGASPRHGRRDRQTNPRRGRARSGKSSRKTAVLTGKEELIELREDVGESRSAGRREEVEREERRVTDREGLLNRKYELLEQRERETTRRTERPSELARRRAHRPRAGARQAPWRRAPSPRAAGRNVGRRTPRPS